MFKFNKNFIGYDLDHRYELFSGSDTEKLFQQTLKNMPENWYYRKTPIEYIRNSLGHRSKEIDEIDLDNYILTTGCSHTEGTGLEMNKTYSYLLSQKFKCDYYNLGLAASGIDVMMHNLVTWMLTVKKQPKFVVMQYPSVARFSTINLLQDPLKTDPADSVIAVYTANAGGSKEHSMFLTLGEKINYFQSKVAFARVMAKSLFTVPIIEVHMESPVTMNYQILFIGHDQARDGHHGIISNYIVSGSISKAYKECLNNKVGE